MTGLRASHVATEAILVVDGRADITLGLKIGSLLAVTDGRNPDRAPHKSPGKGREKTRPERRTGAPQKSGNPRLTEQTRKVLGKHYANKYRVK